MKFKSTASLLSLVTCTTLLLFPLGSAPTTSAQRERSSEQSADARNDRADKPHDAPVGACAVPPVKPEVRRELAERSKKFRQKNVRAYSLASGSVTIPVYFHVIYGDTAGNVAEDVLDEQIRVLNEAFSGGTNSPNTSFRFVKACVDRVYETTWFNMSLNPWAPDEPTQVEREAKNALHRGGATELNFYTVNNAQAWARFPWEYANDPAMDGVVIPFTMLPGGSATNFNLGDIAVHEVGHWLGLWHTFEGGCSQPNDEVSDTPAHREPRSAIGACPLADDTCPDTLGLDPGLDPYDNFMTDSNDGCKVRFTPQQSERMDMQYAQFRQPRSCPVQCGPTTASIAWIAPSESTWGPPNTLTAAGYVDNGCGNLRLHWRDLTIGGDWTVAEGESVPYSNNTWSHTINSPYKCHTFEAYVEYSGVTSPVFTYNGVNSGYCDESVELIWVQPDEPGAQGRLRVAGRALNAPAGTPIYVWYNNVTAGTGWVRHHEGVGTLPDGIWMLDIPNANFYDMYHVQAEYDVVNSALCTYWGNNSISWCQ